MLFTSTELPATITSLTCVVRIDKHHFHTFRNGFVDDHLLQFPEGPPVQTRTDSQVGFDAFDKNNKSIWLTRPSDIIKASPIINSLFINKRLSGFDRMMCWYTNNTKTINRDGNITYGKIEPKLRKTDGFMAFVHAMCCIDSLPEIQDLPSINIGTFTY